MSLTTFAAKSFLLLCGSFRLRLLSRSGKPGISFPRSILSAAISILIHPRGYWDSRAPRVGMYDSKFIHLEWQGTKMRCQFQIGKSSNQYFSKLNYLAKALGRTYAVVDCGLLAIWFEEDLRICFGVQVGTPTCFDGFGVTPSHCLFSVLARLVFQNRFLPATKHWPGKSSPVCEHSCANPLASTWSSTPCLFLFLCCRIGWAHRSFDASFGNQPVLTFRDLWS